MASELLLFLYAREYQVDCMMKPKPVFSGHYLNPSRIHGCFLGETGYPKIAQLVRSDDHGVQVCVASRGNFVLTLRHSNHSIADVYVDEITNTIRDDVKLGRTFVFPVRRLRGYRDCRLVAGSSQIQHKSARGGRLKVLERPANDKSKRRHQLFVCSNV